MTGLVRYEAARAALQAAHSVDEVKDLRDKAQAMAAYAMQAKDTELVGWATEIKVRAERRAGSMLAEMKINGARHNGHNNLKTPPESGDRTPGITLDSLGVSKNQSSDWQALAAVPETQFEQAVATAKKDAGKVTSAAVRRMTRKENPQPSSVAAKAKAKPSKPTIDTVPVEKFNKLAEAYDKLKDNAEVLADELKTCQELKLGDAAKAMNALRGEIKDLKRRRDALMNENAEMRKTIRHLQGQIKKASKK